jgi:hypothetical protein
MARMMSAPDGGRRDAVIGMLAEALAGGRAVTLALEGDSMSPALAPGARLRAASCDTGRARPGDILLYRAGKRLVCHRLLLTRGSGASWAGLTSGDARPHVVTWVGADDVLGRVVAVEAPVSRSLDTVVARLAARLRVARALAMLVATRLRGRLAARVAWVA